ncbi:MAG TPA: NUDIX hydrolase [Streptosporangiaceae bacterium]|jgi:8-oxo-dGTP diphosphatase
MPDPADGEVRAAGAVTWRPGPDGPQVALVHRRRYDDWSFPKGKAEPGEHPLLTAVREVAEETGVRVLLGRPVGPVRYQAKGRPKRVDYWAGQCAEEPAVFEPNAEVDVVDWLSLPAARQRLSYPRDVGTLDRFAAGPARTVPLILLRHAEAGHRGSWPGDDLDRPLSQDGAAVAEMVARLLTCFGPHRVITSTAERCVGTVRPFAVMAGAHIELEAAFTVGQPDGEAAAARAAAIARDGLPAVICAHRENIPVLLNAACAQLGATAPDAPGLDKGGFWVLQSAEGKLASAECHHPGDEPAGAALTRCSPASRQPSAAQPVG